MLNPKHILVASMPKAAGTFLLQSMTKRSKLPLVTLLPAFDRREMELSGTKAVLNYPRSYVTGSHLCYSKGTERLIRYHRLKPIILYRNLFDCAMSLRDHIRKESFVFSMAYFDETFQQMDDAELELAISELVMPWYVKFYLTWQESNQTALWLSYEEVTQQTVTTFGKIEEFTGVNFGNTADINLQNVRYNVGRSGRGDEMCSKAKDAIFRLGRHYSNHDLAAIGLN